MEAPVYPSPILALLHELHSKFDTVLEGEVATYIPELGRVEPNQFGIAIVTADGHLYAVGDAQARFTIQSISKPLVYGLVLQDRGREEVLRRIGVEPSGDAFNSIQFDERNNRPFNAMVNAGAIVATSLIRGNDKHTRMRRLLDFFHLLAGQSPDIDDAVFRSEMATGNRNRAIAYLELNNGMIDSNVDEHLELYFQQCSILTSAVDLAFVAATLANGGVHPRTGQRALEDEHVRDVLSVMTTCGMYDYAGEWELRVGLPAKSGVGGGIMAVLPGQLGIGVFSPRLDSHGNSVRGIRVCEELTERLHLHLLAYRGRARSAVRRSYRGTDIRSKRIRSRASSDQLDRKGAGILVVELEGDLSFSNTEQALRTILEEKNATHVIVEIARVNTMDLVAGELLRKLLHQLAADGMTLLFANASEALQDVLAVPAGAIYDDLDHALEYCEDRLLGFDAERIDGVTAVTELEGFEMLADLDRDELAVLKRHLTPRRFMAGERIIRNGAAADALYFLCKGSVNVCVGSAAERSTVRIASIDAGNVFGELALIGGAPRTADVVAETEVSVLELKTSEFAMVSREHPKISAKLVTAVAKSLSERLRRANAAIRALLR